MSNQRFDAIVIEFGMKELRDRIGRWSKGGTTTEKLPGKPATATKAKTTATGGHPKAKQDDAYSGYDESEQGYLQSQGWQ